MRKVRFEIPGEPTGKGRPRFSKFGGPRSPEKTVLYENLIKTCYSAQCHDFMFEQGKQLDVRIIAYYTIPQSISKKRRQRMLDKIERPLKKPDADNVVKVVLDALNKIAYYDDTQVVDLQIRRFYGENPRTIVTIEDITPEMEETQNGTRTRI